VPEEGVRPYEGQVAYGNSMDVRRVELPKVEVPEE